MKKVVFICLLSLSACLSQPTEPLGKPLEAVPAPQEQASNKTDKGEKLAPVVPEAKPDKPEVVVPTKNTNHTEEKPNVTNTTEKLNTTVTPNKSDANGKENKTEKPTPTAAPTIPPAPTVPAAPTSSNATEKASTDAPHVTTLKPDVHPSTSPVVSSTPGSAAKQDVFVQKRGFDGPSFIGGIILTLGMLAVGFMGFKYYKNQTERNYHTL